MTVKRFGLYVVGITVLVVAPIWFALRERRVEPSSDGQMLQRATTAVSLIASGKVQASKTGEVVLPPSLSDLTITGSAFVTKRRGGLILIYFPIQSVRIGQRGYLYVNRALTRSEEMLRNGRVGVLVRSDADTPPTTPGLAGSGALGGMSWIPLTKSIDRQWWYSQNYDNIV